MGITVKSVSRQPQSSPDRRSDPAYRRQFHTLERREWWLWGLSASVILILTSAVVILALPMLSSEKSLWSRLSLEHSVRGLIGAVLIFDIYALYQQFALKRLRSHLETEIVTNLELQQQAEWFHQLSTTDPLTGLFNRRFAAEQLRHEISRAHRYGRRLAVALFDLDQYKQINDHYGHLTGDEVLREFAALLREKSRASDACARYGGDEFLVILPESAENQAKRFLERVGRSLEVNAGGRKIQLGISAGCAGYQEGDSAEALLERADQSLYASKRQAT